MAFEDRFGMTASGSAAGAKAGSSAGPYGALAGGIIGGILGTVWPTRRDEADKAEKQRQKDLEQMALDYQYERQRLNQLGLNAYQGGLSTFGPTQGFMAGRYGNSAALNANSLSGAFGGNNRFQTPTMDQQGMGRFGTATPIYSGKPGPLSATSNSVGPLTANSMSGSSTAVPRASFATRKLKTAT